MVCNLDLFLKITNISFISLQAYLGSLVGIGDNYYTNIASVFAFASGLFKNNSYSDVLEINDTIIFGVGVRIYKPVIKTNESVGNKTDEEVLLPGLIYFHGGGWTIGTLGKLQLAVAGVENSYWYLLF